MKTALNMCFHFTNFQLTKYLMKRIKCVKRESLLFINYIFSVNLYSLDRFYYSYIIKVFLRST